MGWAPKGQISDYDKLCFLSYNSRGLSSLKKSFIKYLVSPEVVGSNLPIICSQETFLLRENSYKITQSLPGFQLIINPAVKNSHDMGRPRNGMFVGFPESIRNQVRDVSPGFWRLQAVIINLGGVYILLINSYFPTDPRRPNADHTELLETLSHISEIIRKNDFDHLLWTGDINADFIRRTDHTNTIKEQIDDLGLAYSWQNFEIDFTCRHELLGNTHVSVLDHFFWSQQLGVHVEDAGVLHLPDNSSDHSPIYCVISFQGLHIEKDVCKPHQQQPRPSWSKAKSEEKVHFKSLLEERISNIAMPASMTLCRNVKCRDPCHIEELDKFTLEMLETLQDVAEQCLPLQGGGGRGFEASKAIAGWREAVKPFREEAYFWHQLWMSHGRPLNTDLHIMMKRTRNKYHYEYKKCCKAQEKVKRNKLLDSCINGNGDLFKEIKVMRKCKPIVASSMDGVTENVQNHFKNSYEQLYNSADDKLSLLDVQKHIEAEIDDKSIIDVEKVTPEVIREGANKLKSGKSDPAFSFSSDCLKNATPSFYRNLSIILQGFLIHGHVTLILLLATLVPIIKDKLGSLTSSKNYRSIAISSLILKLIDWIFLHLFGVKFNLNDLQFAYQAGCSTTMCTWAVIETVDWFMRNGSEVFTCAMDMTKAFDLTLHSLLFKKMIKAGFSLIFLRLFVFIYINQVANVRWNGEFSDLFPMTNGVRQGAVLSAIAYCFYCEDLFTLLEQRRSGCWVLGRYHGIFGYSDDNWLLAPSLSALQDMLTTCEEYAVSHNLKFSTDENPEKCKTKLMAFLKKKRELPNLKLCGTDLPWVNKVKHLGNTISNTMDGCQMDMKVKSAKFVDKSNTICQEFYFTHPYTKVMLNNIYNGHFTGSQLWKIDSPEYRKILSTFNKSVKIMYDLPWATHRYFLEPLIRTNHVSRTLVKKYLSFIASIRKSVKPNLRQLLQIIQNDTRSTTGYNLRTIMMLANKNTIEDL